jgi:hypothetical protein
MMPLVELPPSWRCFCEQLMSRTVGEAARREGLSERTAYRILAQLRVAFQEWNPSQIF